MLEVICCMFMLISPCLQVYCCWLLTSALVLIKEILCISSFIVIQHLRKYNFGYIVKRHRAYTHTFQKNFSCAADDATLRRWDISFPGKVHHKFNPKRNHIYKISIKTIMEHFVPPKFAQIVFEHSPLVLNRTKAGFWTADIITKYI